MEAEHDNNNNNNNNSSKSNGGIIGAGAGGSCSSLYVKVMTDEQLELLRQQISVYTTISDQLVQMHKSITSQHDLAGLRLGNLYCDPMMACSGHKITSRQRWTPTPLQLQILERIFDEGNGTPSKQKIKDITNELGQHGQISETNVYNWFQNRRARSKRKQSASTTNQLELEPETEVESPKDNKTREDCDYVQFFENLSPYSVKDLHIQSPDIGFEHLLSKIEVSGCYSSYFL